MGRINPYEGPLRRLRGRVLAGLAAAADWPLQISGPLYELRKYLEFYRATRTFAWREDDIFIVTYPRSSTTWMQMVLYQLTTDGDMNFGHIAEHCPWFERALANPRQDLDALPAPRVFKTHLTYGQIPKWPVRYIYVHRDGRDVVVSLFHHYRNLLGYRGEFADFFERFMDGRVQYGSWFDHVSNYRRNARGLRILFLTYEALKSDLETCLKRIAAFCELPLDDEKLARVRERCGFDFMKGHEEKFEHINELIFEKGQTRGAFIRKGQSGGWRDYLDERQVTRFGKRFHATLGRDLTMPE